MFTHALVFSKITLEPSTQSSTESFFVRFNAVAISFGILSIRLSSFSHILGISPLQSKYVDEWVAVVDKKVVSHGKDIKKLKDEAEKITKIPRNEIPIAYIECGANVYCEIIRTFQSNN